MSEPRDVLAKAIYETIDLPDEIADDACKDASDAGLAALRAKGWSVVRTADVNTVVHYLDSQRDIWDEQASRSCDSLEEAIR